MSADTPCVAYGDGATFARVCPKCGRFVKPDESISFDWQGQPVSDTATCKRGARVEMDFQGYYDPEEE